MSSLFPNVTFAKMNPEENEASTSKFNIHGYPTFILFKEGKLYRTYLEDIGEEKIKKWLNQKLLPLVTILNSPTEIDDFIKKNHKALIGYFNSQNDLEYKRFEKQNKDYKFIDDFSTGVVLNEELVSKEGQGTIKVFPENGEPQKFLQPMKTFPNWLLFHGFPPLVQNYTYEIYSRIDDINVFIAILYYNSSDPIESKSQIKLLEELGETFKYKILFVHSDGIQFSEDSKQFSPHETPLPIFQISKIQTVETFLFSDKFEKDSLMKWINKVIKNQIKPTKLYTSEMNVVDQKNQEEIEMKHEKFQEVTVEEMKQIQKSLEKKDEL
jgi:hypothetical protein